MSYSLRQFSPVLSVGLATLAALLIFGLSGCSRCGDSEPAPSQATPVKKRPKLEIAIAADIRCESMWADDSGRLQQDHAPCPGLVDAFRMSGNAMQLVAADGKAYDSPLVKASRDGDMWRFETDKGRKLAGLYARVAQARRLFQDLGWDVSSEPPVAVVYPFTPPGAQIPAEWRLDYSFPRKALLLPEFDGGGQAPALSRGQATRATAMYLLMRRFPQPESPELPENRSRFAQNARYVLIQSFAVYLGAVAAGSLDYMDTLNPDAAYTPQRVGPLDKRAWGQIPHRPSDQFNPAPISMTLAACYWEARQHIRKEDRHDVDAQALAAFLSAEPLQSATPDPVKVVNHVAHAYDPAPREAFCLCLKARSGPFAYYVSACNPYVTTPQ